MSNSGYDVNRRIELWQWASCASLLFSLLALFFFQVLKADEYVLLASRNRLRMVRIQPPRGLICDANGIPLATNVRTFAIEGYPLDLKEELLKDFAGLLSHHGIPYSFEDLSAFIARQYPVPYRAVILVSNLTLAQMAELVSDPNFPRELFPVIQWKRSYPVGAVVAHVIGYVGEISADELSASSGGYEIGDVVGKNGIEKFCEARLRGKPGGEVVEVDAIGRRVGELGRRSPRNGENVVLTVDLASQKIAAEMLEGRKGAIVALDVRDGAVKVLYSSPSFDPAPLAWGLTRDEWKALADDPDVPMMNRAIGGSYPPGSIFKPVTLIAGLAEGVVTPRTKVYCPGRFELGDRTFRCWRSWGHGSVDAVKALRESCDVYFYQLGVWTGIDPIVQWAQALGVGKATGIALPGEIAGNIGDPDWKLGRFGERWYQGDTVNYAIGQGFLLVTPIQIARLFAGIANGGKFFRPRLISDEPIEYNEVSLSSEILKTVQKGLEGVVRPGGTGEAAGKFGVSVAGKTGTAQNPHGEDHAWFVGYAPADKPRYVAVALVEGGGKGSEVAAPIVGRLLASLVERDGGKKRE
ncbi:MAG: penicillin-binding protein 2 [Synergistota bacterium]|nr:penicillin-binding protein 2 [Synergistota bacterium]